MTDVVVFEAQCTNEHCSAHRVWVLLRDDDEDDSCGTCGRPLGDRQRVPRVRYADPDAEPDTEPDDEDEGP